MTAWRTIFSSMAAALIAGSPLHATTYYVATNGVDTNSGLDWEHALLTVATGVAKAVTAGDTVLLKSGVHGVTAQINVANAITIRSASGNPADTIVKRTTTAASRLFYLSHSNCMVSGLTITNGLMTGNYFTEGGAMRIDGGKVSNCVFAANYTLQSHGGAVGIYAGQITIADCVFRGNAAGTNAVGMYGGAIKSSGPATVTVVRCTFDNNRASSIGGAVSLAYGRVLASTFTNNAAVSYGGGLHFGYGLISNCTFVGNSAGTYGGGLYASGNATVDLCRIIMNTQTSMVAASAGGGIFLGAGLLRNTLVARNTAYTNAGGVCLSGGYSSVRVENCTIVSNSTTYGAGLAVVGQSYFGYLTNNIIQFNRNAAGTVSNYTGWAYFGYCCTTPKPTGSYDKGGNTNAEPLFANLAEGNYDLQATSICVNAGTNLAWMTGARDVVGRPRIARSRVDMGAYENVDTSDVETRPVPGSDGGGVAYDFWIGQSEVMVGSYILFLNASESVGDIFLTNGAVANMATGERYCLTTSADSRAYVAYNAAASPGFRFTAVTNRADHPVIFVSWFGAAAYCNWFSVQKGLTPIYDPANGWTAATNNTGYRLPMEGEWQKAAAWDKNRGTNYLYGTSSDSMPASDANFLNSGDAYEGNPLRTSPAGSYLMLSPYGLADMSGNVWEWCHGYFAEGGTAPAVDAHAARGGSWGNLLPDVRVASRTGFKPGDVLDSVGFRVLSRTAPNP